MANGIDEDIVYRIFLPDLDGNPAVLLRYGRVSFVGTAIRLRCRPENRGNSPVILNVVAATDFITDTLGGSVQVFVPQT